MFRVNTNIQAINAQRHLLAASADLSTRIQRLSSGLRINSPADDAAGQTAADAMQAQLAGQRTSSSNISRAITLIQTADSGLEQIGNMFVRLKELAAQAADGTLNNDNRSAISAEAAALIAEINRISQSTVFNGMTLIASASGASFTFFIGDGTNATAISNQRASLALKGVEIGSTTGIATIGATSAALTLAYFGTQTGAEVLVTVADTAANAVAQIRTELGAFQNRLERTQSNLLVAIENTENAQSTIRDADFAMEAAALTRAQILLQAGTAMLSQANQLPGNALAFLT